MADVDLEAAEHRLSMSTTRGSALVMVSVIDIDAVLRELIELRGQACPECRHNRPRDMGHFTHEQFCYLHTRPVSFFRGCCRAGEAKVTP